MVCVYCICRHVDVHICIYLYKDTGVHLEIECMYAHRWLTHRGQPNIALNISPFKEDFSISISMNRGFSHCHVWFAGACTHKKCMFLNIYICIHEVYFWFHLVDMNYWININKYIYIYYIYMFIVFKWMPHGLGLPNWWWSFAKARPKACTASGLKPARRRAVGRCRCHIIILQY